MNNKKRSSNAQANTEFWARAYEAKWQKDRLDPDNWVTIPEFGVLPGTVNYVGFADPLVHPNSPNRDLAEHLRLILQAARARVRVEFPTYQQLINAAWTGGGLTHAFWESGKCSTAVAYRLLEVTLIRAVAKGPNLSPSAERNYRESLLETVAKAGALLAAMTLNDAKAIAKMAKINTGGSLGGRKGAATRSRNAIDADAVFTAALQLNYPYNRNAAAALAMRFNCTPQYIYKLIKKREAEVMCEGLDFEIEVFQEQQRQND